MPPSAHLKDLREVWGESCHSMWVELLALRCTAQFILSSYPSLDKKADLQQIVYAPESRSRLNGVNVQSFLDRLDHYLGGLVTSRIVLLSAGFEQYFSHFLDDYLRDRPKFFDSAATSLTPEGNKVRGEIISTRGLAERVSVFAQATGAKIHSIIPKLPALGDVYILRNLIAHRAGTVDAYAASTLRTLSLSPGSRLVLSVDQLMGLAAPVLEVAASLDSKIS